MQIKNILKNHKPTENNKPEINIPTTPQPFFKWVGGKRELIKNHPNLFPTTYNTYHEPFLGAGAAFYHLQPKQAYLSDLNPELITTYNTIKTNITETNELLQELAQKHSKELYYEIRSLDRNNNWHNLTPIEQTARFLYLNRTGFNGLYRVNLKGELNTAVGKPLTKTIHTPQQLINISKYLQNYTFTNQSYINTLNNINKNDLVYLDPPYAPITKTANFTSYTKENFSWENQQELQEYCNQINQKGATFIQSNSDTPELRELYKNYHIQTIEINRNISSNTEKRGKINEILISNKPLNIN